MADYAADQQISDMEPEAQEMIALMSLKRTILNAPGTKLSQLYYSAANSTVDAVEITYNVGRYISSLSTPLFNAQSQVILANSSFVGETYLHLELPNLYENQTLSRGWAYQAIQQISIIMGSSNVSQVVLNGQSVFHKIMSQCETSEKRSEMLRLAGDEYLTPIMRLNPNTGLPERDPDAIISADILLPFYFSSASGLFNKKSFDTNLLNNPITFQIQFGPVTSIYGGIPTTQTPFPGGFNNAQMIFRQGDLFSKNVSMKRFLATHPDESMFYPDIFSQSYVPTTFFGSTDVTSPISIPLLGFINADLCALTIGVVRADLIAPPTGQSPNAFQFDPIQNIRLLFNGTIMFQAPRSSWKLFTMKSGLGGQYVQGSYIQPTLAGLGPYQSIPQDLYLLHIDFSAIRSTTFEGMFQNVWRIANNTLTLQFNTSQGELVRYNAYVTYHYNAVLQVQQGQSALYFS